MMCVVVVCVDIHVLAAFTLCHSCVMIHCIMHAVLFVYKRREKKSLSRLAYAYGPDLELSTVRAQRYHRTNHSSQQNMW